jgi:AraC-like DNA-binding protein
MSHPARFAPETFHVSRSSLFTGRHVQLDEARWSPAFEAQVRGWASSATLLLMLENGEALLILNGDASSAVGTPRTDFQSAEPASLFVARPRPMELCAVFRFEPGVAGTVCVAPNFLPVDARQLGRRHVQLSPRALLRYYWRRHAIELGYPAPDEHVEEDAIGLLRHVTARARADSRGDSASLSQGRSRHNTLARNAKALMALKIADPHPIAEIAQALDTSPFHLAHVFRTEVGSSPHKYLVQLRLIAALVHLRNGTRDLSKLALDLGFCHHSHFTAVFRQTLGYTPREVRRMLTAECIADLGIVARCSG